MPALSRVFRIPWLGWCRSAPIAASARWPASLKSTLAGGPASRLRWLRAQVSSLETWLTRATACCCGWWPAILDGGSAAGLLLLVYWAMAFMAAGMDFAALVNGTQMSRCDAALTRAPGAPTESEQPTDVQSPVAGARRP